MEVKKVPFLFNWLSSRGSRISESGFLYLVVTNKRIMKNISLIASFLCLVLGLNAQTNQMYFDGVGVDGKHYQAWFVFPEQDPACQLFGVFGCTEDGLYMSTSLEEKEREMYLLFLPDYIPVTVFWTENKLNCFRIGEGFSLNKMVVLEEKKAPFLWNYESVFAERKNDPLAIELGGLDEMDQPICRTWIHGQNVEATTLESEGLKGIQDSLLIQLVYGDSLIKSTMMDQSQMQSGTEWAYSIFPCRVTTERMTFLCREDKTICGRDMDEYDEKYVHFNLLNSKEIKFHEVIQGKEEEMLNLLQQAYASLLQTDRFSWMDTPMEVMITDNYFLLEQYVVFVYQPGEIAPPEESVVYLHVPKEGLKTIGVRVADL